MRHPLPLDVTAIQRLRQRVRQSPEIFGFDYDPSLAALCTCLGLQGEMGIYGLDRLGPVFNVDFIDQNDRSWCSSIFIENHDVGISFTPPEGERLLPKHPDLRFVLDPSSIDSQGELQELVFFPTRIAEYYANKGVELVIVRDWVLSSTLCPHEEQRVFYTATNTWELANNNARYQWELMSQKQLAFSGTHDFADHLLGFDFAAVEANQILSSSLLKKFRACFAKEHKHHARRLKVSYLIGVLLDDLAQPVWYGSQRHTDVIKSTLRKWQDIDEDTSNPSLQIPQVFHELIATIRGKGEWRILLQNFFHALS